MEKIYRTLIALALLLIPYKTTAELTLQAPYIEELSCPFECCQFGEWTAKSPLFAYSREGDTSTVAFKINPNEKFIALTGKLHIERFGKVRINRPIYEFQKGDIILALRCEPEEGFNGLLPKSGPYL